MRCAITCPMPSVRVCSQPCQIVSDPYIWKCKTPRRAEQGLFRGSHQPQGVRGCKAALLPENPRCAFMRHPPSWSIRVSRVPCVPPPAYPQPIVQHRTVTVATSTELQCCFVLGYRIAVGYAFVHYVISRDLSLRIRSPWVAITHEVADGAISTDRHDLSVLSSQQGLSQGPVRGRHLVQGSPGVKEQTCCKSFVQRPLLSEQLKQVMPQETKHQSSCAVAAAEHATTLRRVTGVRRF